MMGGASIQFLAYALGVAVIFNLSGAKAWRQAILLIASIVFLTFFSRRPTAFIPLAAFLAFGYLSVRLMQTGRTRAFVPLLAAGILAFVWLKKYAFLPAGLFLEFPYLTLGLSYIFFRVLHLLIDAHSGNLPAEISIVSYLNYTLNFTTLVSGPIQQYQDFADMQLRSPPLPLDIVSGSRAFERIVVGFFKVNVMSLLLSMAQSHGIVAFDAAQTSAERVWAAVTIVAAYPLYLYCNFSGYIDIVIGIARFLRLELPENFDRPFSSKSFLIFWNRWHITLSTWLKTYVYNPLLIVCMRRWPSPAIEPFLAVFAFFVTFFLIGVWHGQTSVYIFYGVLLGLGVSVNKLYQILMTKRLGRKRYNALAAGWVYSAAARGLTFTWFTLSLLWFWSNWHQLGLFERSMTGGQIALVWGIVFLGSSAILSVWETLREGLLSFKYGEEPLLASRYAKTVRATAFAVLAVATILLLNAPAPDIVYKAF